jgi:hypothetical protein
MTEDEIKMMKLQESLLQAIRRNPAVGVQVTAESFVAAAELVKNEQADVMEIAGKLFIRNPA